MKKALLIVPAVLGAVALAGWGAFRIYQEAAPDPVLALPATSVKRGDVTLTVHARGELQGGESETLFAPAIGGSLIITFLSESGDLVGTGDLVVQFDTTEQEYKLREAEADLAEAEQQVVQAQAESQAKEEEARSALIMARTDLRVAELEARKNELLAAIVARNNELAVAAARDKVQQLDKDLGDRIGAAKAGIAIQEAAREKARVASETARRNIEQMTLRAKRGGYVARAQNMQGSFRWGMYIPPFRVGDTVHAGLAVAQIPDLTNWEVAARIGELDRGHLVVGQKAEIEVVHLPGRTFHGRIKNIGGTAGPPWDRRFECHLAIDDPSPELRPGASIRLRITTEVMRSVLWLPSQALFESDGRKFVYRKTGETFAPVDVKLVRRSESQVVVEGLQEGQMIALASPDQMKKQQRGRSGALEAIPR